MSRITKYALSDLYEMSSGISSTKEQAGHGAPFVSFSTVFNNYFLPDELFDLMDTNEKEQEIYSIKAGDVLITRTSETIDELAMSCVAVKDYPKATYSGFTKRLRPKKEGIAYTDDDDFRTTRVVIQCKRYNTAPVSEPDINQFLGAMNKFQADYGVFITNSRFTNAAREAAREGTPITLIDGNDLVRLVIKYELYITPVTTYVLDDFYDEE